MGPHAVLTDRTVRENIMTGVRFLGCKSCGTYDRHNQVTQVALAYLRYELPVKFTGSTSSLAVGGSNYVGTSADGKSKHTGTAGQVWGSLPWLRRLAINVSIVNPTAVSHSGAGA
jgi:hypothetical protein